MANRGVLGKGLALAILLILIVAVTLVTAQGDQDRQYYACVNNASGTIHMVSGEESCANNEELVVWNSEGPPGPPGEDGPTGPQGPQGPQGDPGICTCDVTRTEFEALTARVEALEPECSPEICDYRDNDCDALIDEDFRVGEDCYVGVGQCARSGRILCTPDGRAGCSAVPGTPGSEICGDSLDNDCDGQVDEGCSG